MKLNTFWFLGLMLVSGISHAAAEKDYSLCSVAGFYEGSNNRFLTDLAERVATKNNLFGVESCNVAFKEGKAVGERSIKPNAERRVTDIEIIRNAQSFSNSIYNSLLSRVQF